MAVGILTFRSGENIEGERQHLPFCMTIQYCKLCIRGAETFKNDNATPDVANLNYQSLSIAIMHSVSVPSEKALLLLLHRSKTRYNLLGTHLGFLFSTKALTPSLIFSPPSIFLYTPFATFAVPSCTP